MKSMKSVVGAFALVACVMAFASPVSAFSLKKKLLKKLISPYQGYQLYFARVNRGRVSSMALPSRLRKELQPYFRNSLGGVRIVISRNVHGNNAMTDCRRMFFPAGKGVMRRLKRKVVKRGMLRWLLHELTHTEQCGSVGGRRRYANMWFRQVGKTTLLSLMRKKKVNEKKIHDRMPMERAASRKSRNVLRKVLQKRRKRKK